MCRGINISMNKNKNNNHKYKNNKKKTNKVLTKRQKLEKKFRNVKREYLRCSRMLFHCRNDLKNMINPELIRQKKEQFVLSSKYILPLPQKIYPVFKP